MVFSDNYRLTLQCLGLANKITVNKKWKIGCLFIEGLSGEEPIKLGVDVLIKIKNTSSFNIYEDYKQLLVSAINKFKPKILLIGATKLGKEVAPRLAAIFDAGCISQCIELELDEESRPLAKRLVYGGTAYSIVRSESDLTIITLPSNVFEPITEHEVRIQEIFELPLIHHRNKMKIIERRSKQKPQTDLENAKIIVSAGRGFSDKEDLELLHKLSEALNAEIGCSRPMAADYGWFNEWIGLSGKKVKPQLYIACGISGTIQHIAGMRDSKIVVSINKDESAPIHNFSDYSIIGDIYEIIPMLTKTMKTYRKQI